MIKLPILSDLSGFNLNKSMYDQVTTLIRSYVDEHVGSFDPHSCPRDFMDIYLKEISKTQDPWSSFHPARGHASLINMCVDLFVVGTETTSSALLWIVLYLLHHEDIQARIHYEIEKVCKRGLGPRRQR
jgi:cytochrome P450